MYSLHWLLLSKDAEDFFMSLFCFVLEERGIHWRNVEKFPNPVQALGRIWILKIPKTQLQDFLLESRTVPYLL